MKAEVTERPQSKWRIRLFEIVFEDETASGRAFDLTIIWMILFSLLAVVLESVKSIRENYGAELFRAEWFFTILFTIEYLLRLISVRRPFRYILSFYGLIDLLAIIPTY